MTTVVRITVSKPRDVSVRVRVVNTEGAVTAEELCDGKSCEVMFAEQIIHSGSIVIVDELSKVKEAPRSEATDAPHVDSEPSAAASPKKSRGK